jgi:voltage-gated potassium channel
LGIAKNRSPTTSMGIAKKPTYSSAASSKHVHHATSEKFHMRDMTMDDFMHKSTRGKVAKRENFVLHPRHPFVKYAWNYVQAFLTVYSVTFVPVLVCFDELLGVEYRNAQEEIDYGPGFVLVSMVDMLFVLDVFLMFNIAIKKKKTMVFDRRVIAAEYINPKTGTFFVDAISSVPIDFVIAIFSTGERGGGEGASSLKVLRIGRMAKLIRVFRVSRVSVLITKLEAKYQVSMGYMRMVHTIGILLFLTNLLGCLWYGVWSFESKDDDPALSEKGWVYERGLLDEPVSGFWRRYLTSVYWAFTTLSTVGFGDISPQEPCEMLFGMLTMLVGITVYGFLVNGIGTILQNLDTVNAHKKAKIEKIQNFVKVYGLPKRIADKVHAWTQLTELAHAPSSEGWDKDEEESFLKQFSPALRTEILLYRYREQIRKIPFLHFKDEVFIVTFVRMLELTLVDAGDIIFEEGVSASEMFFITEGEVQIWCQMQFVASIVPDTPYSYFGERACFMGGIRTATAIAPLKSLLYSLVHEDLKTLSLQFPSIISDLKEKREVLLEEDGRDSIQRSRSRALSWTDEDVFAHVGRERGISARMDSTAGMYGERGSGGSGPPPYIPSNSSVGPRPTLRLGSTRNISVAGDSYNTGISRGESYNLMPDGVTHDRSGSILEEDEDDEDEDNEDEDDRMSRMSDLVHGAPSASGLGATRRQRASQRASLFGNFKDAGIKLAESFSKLTGSSSGKRLIGMEEEFGSGGSEDVGENEGGGAGAGGVEMVAGAGQSMHRKSRLSDATASGGTSGDGADTGENLASVRNTESAPGAVKLNPASVQHLDANGDPVMMFPELLVDTASIIRDRKLLRKGTASKPAIDRMMRMENNIDLSRAATEKRKHQAPKMRGSGIYRVKEGRASQRSSLLNTLSESASADQGSGRHHPGVLAVLNSDEDDDNSDGEEVGVKPFDDSDVERTGVGRVDRAYSTLEDDHAEIQQIQVELHRGTLELHQQMQKLSQQMAKLSKKQQLMSSRSLLSEIAKDKAVTGSSIPPPPALPGGSGGTEPPPAPPSTLPTRTSLAGVDRTDLTDLAFHTEAREKASKGDYWQRRSSTGTAKQHRVSLSARRASRLDPTIAGGSALKMEAPHTLVATMAKCEAAPAVEDPVGSVSVPAPTTLQRSHSQKADI